MLMAVPVNGSELDVLGVTEGRRSRNDKVKQSQGLFPELLSLAGTEQAGRKEG